MLNWLFGGTSCVYIRDLVGKTLGEYGDSRSRCSTVGVFFGQLASGHDESILR